MFDPIANAIHHEVRLVALVEGGIELDAFAIRAARPERLAEPAGIVLDEGIGRFQDGAGGAVVLLQLVQRRLRIVAAELVQILHARAAPPVDRLVVVAHREQLSLRAREQRQPPILDGIGVLEFVDQNMAEAGAVMLQQGGIVAPHLERAQQQLCEIHDTGALTGLFVGLIDPDQLAPGRIAVILDVLRPHAFVFLRVDEPQNLARHPAGLVQIERLQDLAQEPRLILGIEDLEALRQAGLAPMLAQQPMGETVEGADPQPAARKPQQSFDAPAHFRRGLVGERDREDAVGRCALHLDQPGDPVHQHPGLAAAGAREHERGALRRGHRLPLRVIQAVE